MDVVSNALTYHRIVSCHLAKGLQTGDQSYSYDLHGATAGLLSVSRLWSNLLGMGLAVIGFYLWINVRRVCFDVDRQYPKRAVCCAAKRFGPLGVRECNGILSTTTGQGRCFALHQPGRTSRFERIGSVGKNDRRSFLGTHDFSLQRKQVPKRGEFFTKSILDLEIRNVRSGLLLLLLTLQQ